METDDTSSGENGRSTKEYVIPVLILLILLLFGGISFFLLRQRTSILPRASEEVPSRSSVVSLENSYVFASPVRATTGGEKIRITVFILDANGLGIGGRTVEVGTDDAIIVTQVQNVTDDTGRAFFDVSSNTPGTYYIEVSSGGQVLPQRARVTFD